MGLRVVPAGCREAGIPVGVVVDGVPMSEGRQLVVEILILKQIML